MADGPEDRRGGAVRVIGKVIKGGAASSEGPAEIASDRPALRPPGKGVLNAEQFEAMTTASKIIQDAKAEAERILEEAQKQREEVFHKAREEARAEVMAAATAELAKAKMQAGQLLAAAETECVQLSLKIAEKIVGRALELDPSLVVEIAATAMENVRTAKAMILRVNPRDAQLLREKRPKLMELIGRTVDLAIKDDADVKPGGCIIQTEFGTIDAELKTQLEMLKQVLVPDTAKREMK